MTCVFGRGCLLWPVCSLGKTLLAFALLHWYSKAKFTCYSRYFVTSYFCIPVPYNEKNIFLVLKGLTFFIESFNFSFFSIADQGIDLDYYDMKWFALETNRDHSVIFEIASKYCISEFFDYDGYSISSKGFLSTVVHIMVIELNSPIPVHFSLLIPKMSMFTLAISCLTTSNLP